MTKSICVNIRVNLALEVNGEILEKTEVRYAYRLLLKLVVLYMLLVQGRVS